MKQVLIIGKEDFVNKDNYECLIKNDYCFDFVHHFSGLEKMLPKKSYDLLIIDSALEEEKIKTFSERLMKLVGNLPVVVVSDNQDDEVVVDSLNKGADLYLGKPVNENTFSAVVEALLRRKSNHEEDRMIHRGPFSFDIQGLNFYKNGQKIHMTRKESILIKYFFDNPGRIISVKELFSIGWSEEIPDKNTIMVYMNRLRAKIEDNKAAPKYIKNVRGKGYLFVVE